MKNETMQPTRGLEFVLENNFKKPFDTTHGENYSEDYIPSYRIRRKYNSDGYHLVDIKISVQNYGNRKVTECEQERKEAEIKANDILKRLNMHDTLIETIRRAKDVIDRDGVLEKGAITYQMILQLLQQADQK